MSALERLKAATRAGVEVTLDGDDLAVNASVQPPDAVLSGLASFKAEIVDLLRPDSHGWTADDWMAFYDERAGVVQRDGSEDQRTAEANALACCVAEWVNRNPLKPRRLTYDCLRCNTHVTCDTGFPLSTPELVAGAWVHNNCIEGFHAYRRAEALDAFSRCGVPARTFME